MSNVTKAVTVISLTLAYCIVRYVGFGEVEMNNLPAFLVNKATALTSVICLCLFMNSLRTNNKTARFFWGKAFFHLSMIHCGLSLALLSPDYFSAFYTVDKHRFSLWGELAVLVGVIGFYISATCTQYASVQLRHRCYQCVLVMAGLHVAFMGGAGWLTPMDWYGGLPPITFISFIVVIIGFLISLTGLNSHADSGQGIQ